MLKIISKKFIIQHCVIWFSRGVPKFSILKLCDYRQCSSNINVPGFLRKDFRTIHVDLRLSEQSILAAFAKNVQYEIRRAERDGVDFVVSNNVSEFVLFYNSFAYSKRRNSIKEADLNKMGQNILFTIALHGGASIVMHSYLIDNDSARVRLLHSASNFRAMKSSQDRALVGRANRFLHFRDMLYFKEAKYNLYDFGGVSIDESDEELRKINDFKKGFGGIVVDESNFLNLLLVLGLKLRELLLIISMAVFK